MKKKDHDDNKTRRAKPRKDRASTRTASPAARDEDAAALVSSGGSASNASSASNDTAPTPHQEQVEAKPAVVTEPAVVREPALERGGVEDVAVGPIHVDAFDDAPPRLRIEAFAPERLRRALEMVLHACPRKEEDGAFVIFERDTFGVPFVAAHDRTRCHYAFLPREAEMMARGAVSRGRVVELRNLLLTAECCEGAAVRVLSNGRVEITRSGQPKLLHDLLPEPTPLRWEPPRDYGALPIAGSLALGCDRLVKAVRYQGATARVEQRTSARVIVNLSLGDELVARAILAENGSELYPVDAAQQSFPFRDEGAQHTRAPGAASVGARAAAFPTPTTKVVVAMASEVWAGLDELTRAKGARPANTPVAWIDCGGEHATTALDADTAVALGRVLASAGLRCVDVMGPDDNDDEDERVVQWQVERTDDNDAARCNEEGSR